jgi:hypothetical protein
MAIIKVFGTEHYACSNLFLTDCDGHNYVYPAPYHLDVQLGAEKESDDIIEIGVGSYFESILMSEYFFSLLFFVIGYDGTLASYIFDTVSKKEEPRSETYGYKCILRYDRTFIHKNQKQEDCYDDLQKLKASLQYPRPKNK